MVTVGEPGPQHLSCECASGTDRLRSGLGCEAPGLVLAHRPGAACSSCGCQSCDWLVLRREFQPAGLLSEMSRHIGGYLLERHALRAQIVNALPQLRPRESPGPDIGGQL